MASTGKSVLILGGTREASEIASRLLATTPLTVISSLAGRVDQPLLPPGFVRIGGFGGAAGLQAYLVENHISAIIDATHPFAATISQTARQVCGSMELPLISYARPPWSKQPGDCWLAVRDMHSAARYVAQIGGRVFLTIGRQHLDAFLPCKQAWFLVRAIDEPKILPRNTKLILERGPFDLAHEIKLLREHAIDLIVSKNSGGPATYAKIEAARNLGLPVVMIQPPVNPVSPSASTMEEVLAAVKSLGLQGHSSVLQVQP